MLQKQYILSLTAALAVALNEHRRFLFLYCFATKMREYGGDIHFVCLEGGTLAKKQFSFKVFFITQLGHRHCLAIIASILDI